MGAFLAHRCRGDRLGAEVPFPQFSADEDAERTARNSALERMRLVVSMSEGSRRSQGW
jgi:hypothetical protein